MGKDPTSAEPVTVRLVQHGERTVEVDPGDLEAALAVLTDRDRDGVELDELFRSELTKIDLDTVAILPNGQRVDLLRVFRTIQPTLRESTGPALAAVIAASRTRLDCCDCGALAVAPCANHLAEDILAACRLERIAVLTGGDAGRLTSGP